MATRVALVLCVALFVCAQCEEAEPIGDMLSFAQISESVPQVAEMNAEEFAGLMNKIIQKASEMRGVMNKLGISDTDSVRKVEQHFIRLGEQHHDLGDGATSEEELRLHGLRARACVKHAVTCSHMAATCHATPKHCKAVVNNCSHAAAACGIGEDKKVKKKKKKAVAKEVTTPKVAPKPTPKKAEPKKKVKQTKPKAKASTHSTKPKAKEPKGTPIAKGKPGVINLLQESAEESEDNNMDAFRLDDESEALDEELEEAQNDADEEEEEL